MSTFSTLKSEENVKDPDSDTRLYIFATAVPTLCVPWTFA